ncbi:Kynurenine formamidase [Bhargavaea cecembensis DSE10]|uniref:Kynurenine formamidase n=1 Tax=Bhargavaea cecembensis DSE10 TaxID=1235279 RepID=M7P653_9BACL|nr:arylformamidase [Bhargavaea cecembensis]EMR06019.1 Kynurenine formamidase [Bhargavaea cecembensis DSE10]
MEKKRWIDITQPLTNDMAHWPGDTPFRFELGVTKEQSGSVNIGEIRTSLHMGTHADAPFHFDGTGRKLHELDVNTYIGRARVIDVTAHPSLGRSELEDYDLEGVERLLLKSSETNNPLVFPETFIELLPDIGPYLRELGIFLLGIDVPSVDRTDSKELPTHHSLGDNGIHIVENLMLADVEPGDYDFIALPLAIHGADGSPVRAVIKKA